MPDSQSPWHPENEVERLLCSLAGVVSARVVANPLGRLDEIHILASPMLNPKQVVRNVESALAAGLGIVIDRRIVSVAQIRRDALESASEQADAAAARASDDPTGETLAEPEVISPSQRIVFVGWDARSRPDAESECRVTVRREDREYVGAGTGPATSHGRAQAAARAVFAAIAKAREKDDLVLEDAKLVETQGRRYVLVSARAILGRQSRALTGVAPVTQAPEEAAILAALQATNRWTGHDD